MTVVVFLHAFGSSGRSFGPVADRLDGVEVVAPDLPGFGAAASSPPGLDAMVSAAASAAAGRSSSDWVLVGHSMGGKVATLLAARGGASGVVLLAGSPPAPEPMAEERREQMLSWAAGGPLDADAARTFVDMNVGSPLPAALDELAIDDLRRASPDAWRLWLQDGSKQDRRDEVGVLDVPALVVAGGADGDLGADAQRTLNGPVYPDHELLVLPGAGHLLPLERPDEVAEAIADFVRRHPSP